MRVAELRESIVRKMADAASHDDTQALAIVLAHAHALLIALAGHASSEEVDVPSMLVTPEVAAVILGMPPAVVTEMARRGAIPAESEGGEYRIPLGAVADLEVRRMPNLKGPFATQSLSQELLHPDHWAWS